MSSSRVEVHFPKTLHDTDDKDTRGHVTRLSPLEKERLYLQRDDLKGASLTPTADKQDRDKRKKQKKLKAEQLVILRAEMVGGSVGGGKSG